MFAVLDTNHYVALVAGGPLSEILDRKASEFEAGLFTTIITVQEIAQGWLAVVNRERAGREQVFGYARFQRSIENISKMHILPFNEEAAAIFHRLRNERVRVGTMDLKIASICLAHDATLLTRNVADFDKVPDLRVENWLD